MFFWLIKTIIIDIIFNRELYIQMSDVSHIVDIPLRRFFANAADIIIPVDNDKVFVPDPSWSTTFAAGLQKCDLAGSIVAEIGVGSGINMAGLMLSPNRPGRFLGADIARSAVEASQWLAKREGIEATLLQSDLLCAFDKEDLKKVNCIIGCIPQVPMHQGEITSERALSDYYEETGIPEDAFGLGLIARLLDQSAKLAPQASLVLNIASRPGGERVQAMFDRHGFKTNVVHATVVQQDPTTCLKSLAEIEATTGIDFHFYGDADASERIQACEAEQRRQQYVPIFHKLYVLEAKLG